MGDPVSHPDHYGGDVPTEPIKVIREWGMNFALGNAVKYLSRAGKKDPSKKVEDLSKAIFYIEDEIKRGEDSERVPLAPITKTDINTISRAIGVITPSAEDRAKGMDVLDRLVAELCGQEVA